MQICFVTKGTLQKFWENYGGSGADVVFFSFNGMDGEVSYERELKGETGYFEDAALLSRDSQNVVICAVKTDTRGIKRKSVVVAERGRILGVADMLNTTDGEYNPGAGIKVFDTKVGKLGVCVAEDLYFPDVFKTLSVCASDVVFCPFGEIADTTESILLRSYAFSYGVPALLAANGYALAVGTTGEVLFSSPVSPVEFVLEKEREFHLVETRVRGFTKRAQGDF